MNKSIIKGIFFCDPLQVDDPLKEADCYGWTHVVWSIVSSKGEPAISIYQKISANTVVYEPLIGN